MSTIRVHCALAALIAGAALSCGPAQAQDMFTFLRPPQIETTQRYQYFEPQQPAYADPRPAQRDQEESENAQLAPHLQHQVVDYPSREARGTIIIDTPHTFLYYVLGDGKAIRYGIGVGREGFTWSGVKSIIRKTEWPDWYPPPEMLKRQPYLPRMMAGGPGNPLGARAMYIGGTEYRIHGTNDPSTIGKHVSSGCIRMTNDSAIDLFNRVTVGTKVIVLPQNGAPTHEAKAQAAIAASPRRAPRMSWNGTRPGGLY